MVICSFSIFNTPYSACVNLLYQSLLLMYCSHYLLVLIQSILVFSNAFDEDVVVGNKRN